AIAVVFGNESVTYHELNERVNQVAHHLQKIGIGADALVGISMERSIEMIVALYGVLKAGAAYVPLDPEYPAERLAIIVEDAGLPVLLTREGLRNNLPAGETKVICLDSDWDVIAQESKANPHAAVKEDNLAYVIYTSGSTGKPKGVMIPHRAIVNHMLWMVRTFKMDAQDRIVLKTSFGFDASVSEIFAPLLSGAQLVLAPNGWQQNMELLLDTLIEKQITVFQVVPSLLRMVLEMNRPEALKSVRVLFTGAELLPAELKDRLLAVYEGAFINLYGPTEICIDGTYWDTRRTEYTRIVPVGRPIDNMHVYILDKHLQPVPIGVAGELHFGGVGLARGYLNRPEITEEKFIPHPFSQEEGARLYKTGDLARFLPCGNIEFLGRLDFQVKVRGFRIELGEIEATLKQHPSISQALVLARADENGDQSLLAYLVAESTERPSNSELRDFLQKTLPAYMVPPVFQYLDAFPLTPSGKVDRKQLPEPELQAVEADSSFEAPQNEMEQQIASVFAEVLGKEQVGVHDNFFEMGGHSIMVVKVHRKLQEVLGRKDFPVVLMFQHPTVHALAKFLTQGEEKKEEITQQLSEQSQDRADTRRELLKQRGQARVKQRVAEAEGDDWDE
ncbi:MAG: non-ribosomal peptide synthetase, partial [Tumebacillaceae bacterium]